MMNIISYLLLSTVAISYAFALPQYNPFSQTSPKFFSPQSPDAFKAVTSRIGREIASDSEKDKQAHVVSEYRNVDFDGTFSYGFDSSNGISSKTEGFIKDAGSREPKQVIRGSYFYYNKNNEPVNVAYLADENGYRAESDAIPKASPQILKSLEYNAAAAAANRRQ